MIENKLLDLDFRPGIHDEDINFNFRLVEDWIERERLRIGGWGVVEGFDLTKDLPHWAINISQGTLINKQGEEVIMEAHTEIVGPPVFQKYRETVTVSEAGLLTLKFPCYSDAQKHQIQYSLPQWTEKPGRDEFSLTEHETGNPVEYISIVENHVLVSAVDYAGVQIDVNYLYSNDRIDAIFAAQDGSQYLYQKGIISTSPSSPDIAQYEKDYFLLGFAYWHVGLTVDVELLSVGRYLRRVYVDKNNVLWLNGKIYKEGKFIYFVEPEHPEENDIWYDEETNTLYIWREKDGVWGWVPINDQSARPVRNIYIFTEEKNPADLQTFLFDTKTQTDMLFMPGTDALDIYVDNAPLMADQFTEVIQKGRYDYEDLGIGFKLVEPLDRATSVQVVVTRAVRETPQRETFQRMSIFTQENYQPYNGTTRVFHTGLVPESEKSVMYEIGQQQLEVWVNGIRLRRNVDFFEALPDGTQAKTEDTGKLSDTFILSPDYPLTVGDIVTYKVTRHMWAYENLQKVIDTIESDVAYVKKAVGTLPEGAESLQAELDILSENTEKRLDALDAKVQELQDSLPDMSQYVKKTDVLPLSSLGSDVTSKLYGQTITVGPSTAGAATALPGLSGTDYLTVFYVTTDGMNVLFKGTDYTLTTQNGATVLALSSRLVSSSASLYITGIHFGGEA